MKRLPAIALAAAALLALPGCKTTEANYRAAYEIARQKADEGLSDEELDGFLREEATPRALYRGDSISLKPTYVKPVEGGATAAAGEATKAPRYSVVVMSFKQLFNARSAYQRLVEAGYASAAVVEDSDHRYYVAAASAPDLDDLLPLYRSLNGKETAPSDFPLAIKAPYPYILQAP